jgi:hypothetical protein
MRFCPPNCAIIAIPLEKLKGLDPILAGYRASTKSCCDWRAAKS